MEDPLSPEILNALGRPCPLILSHPEDNILTLSARTSTHTLVPLHAI